MEADLSRELALLSQLVPSLAPNALELTPPPSMHPPTDVAPSDDAEH